MALQTDPNALVLEVDQDGVSDADSAFCSQSSTSTSVTSSVFNYKYENGRRYHGFREGNYFLPNDEKEQDRLDLFHHISTLVLDGKLFNAPLENSRLQRALDIGTGTGIWAVDFADDYPECEVVGTDLSPIQPSWVPPNCRFLVDDVEAEWAESKPYDFIHIRTLSGSITDWPRLFQQAYNNLSPGGWIEMQEFEVRYGCDDDSYPAKAPNVHNYMKLLRESSEKFGKRMDIARDQQQWIKDAGFINVKEDLYKAPLSPWAKGRRLKEIGKYNLIHVLDAIEAYSIALFTRVLNYSAEEVQVMLAKMREEYKNPELHIYWIYHVTYGQKPEDA
ncbi:putative tam domain methyltransferase protein [Neofusicoccum parvum UCRNP2]|uniref:Tam domain methyltransferase protein n=2 Tax=Neofusicoccum parvum TaxID=310453 RepID=A0ACB5S690_9PEZI|nr:putative tam domain methyltransferase protein [Neofusicoccum parvum UCRNP2]GME28211.1 putative tam domain methyltransferase protein [Neofusicoccum parvum]